MTAEALSERAERVAALTREQRSATDIAWILGVSVRTVERYRHRLGLSRSECRRERLSEDVLLRAKYLLLDGASYKEVGRTVGAHPGTVAKYLPGFGWSPSEIGRHGRAVQEFNALDPVTALAVTG